MTVIIVIFLFFAGSPSSLAPPLGFLDQLVVVANFLNDLLLQVRRNLQEGGRIVVGHGGDEMS